MIYRIASVSFLNAWPLAEKLRGLPKDRVKLVSGVPSHLSELLQNDQVDAALIPVVEYFRGIGGGIVPGVGICTTGAVDSVKLYSRVPPTEIRHVAVDRGSRTSVALLRVIFAELYDVQPDFMVITPRPESLLQEEDAALVIGDRCFDVDRHLREADNALPGGGEVHHLDLGEIWRQMTGLPFVFAVWAVGRRFIERVGDPETRELAAMLLDAKTYGQGCLEELADRALGESRLGPGGYSTREVILGYFRESLNYDMGGAELAGIRRFQDLCLKHNIINSRRDLEVLDLTAVGESGT